MSRGTRPGRAVYDGSASCHTCVFYSPAGGECRQAAPRFNRTGQAAWPGVKATDWCGEHQLAGPAIVEGRAACREDPS